MTSWYLLIKALYVLQGGFRNNLWENGGGGDKERGSWERERER